MVYLASSNVNGATGTSFTLTSGYDIFEFHFTEVYTNRQSCCTNGIDRLTFSLNFSSFANNTSTVLRATNFVTDTTSASVTYDYNSISDSDNDANSPQLTYSFGSPTSAYYTASGVVTLYDPFNTSSMKHFTSRAQNRYYYSGTESSNDVYRDVYYHTTNPVTSVSFGIGAPWNNYMYGDFYMYGIK